MKSELQRENFKELTSVAHRSTTGLNKINLKNI